MDNKFFTTLSKREGFEVEQDQADSDRDIAEQEMRAEDETAAPGTREDDVALAEGAPEEDIGLDEPKKPGILSKLFAPLPPAALPSYIPGSEKPLEPAPGPVPDNLDGSVGEPEEEEDEDITAIPADDEEWLFGTKDVDPKTGEDFIAGPSDETMADLTGSGSEKGDDDFITGISPEDEEFLTGTTLTTTDGDDFLAAPDEDAINDLLDIGSNDPFLFSTGDDEEESEGGEDENESEYEEGEGGAADEVVGVPAEEEAVVSAPVAALSSTGGLGEQVPVAMLPIRPRVRYTVGPPIVKKSREQRDRETDEFLFGTKGVL